MMITISNCRDDPTAAAAAAVCLVGGIGVSVVDGVRATTILLLLLSDKYYY